MRRVRDFDLAAPGAAFLTQLLAYDRSYAPTHMLRAHRLRPARGTVATEPDGRRSQQVPFHSSEGVHEAGRGVSGRTRQW